MTPCWECGYLFSDDNIGHYYHDEECPQYDEIIDNLKSRSEYMCWECYKLHYDNVCKLKEY